MVRSVHKVGRSTNIQYMLGAAFQYPKNYDIQQPSNPRGTFVALCFSYVLLKVLWRSGRKLNNVEPSLGALIFCRCGSGQKISCGMSSSVWRPTWLQLALALSANKERRSSLFTAWWWDRTFKCTVKRSASCTKCDASCT
jgi:hypothetical protein